MSFTIRPVRTEDYVALAECNRAAMPGNNDSADSFQVRNNQAHAFERWAAEAGGRVVGHASWFQLTRRLHPQKFRMDGAVHPAFQGCGIGTALLDRVLEAVTARNAISLRTASREDHGTGRRFLAKRGFVEARRTWASTLNLDRLDFGPDGDQTATVEAQGIRICQLSALTAVPGWDQRLLDLNNALTSDAPDIDAATAVDMDYLRANYLGSAAFLADGHFIALEGDRWVGLSVLWKGSAPDIMITGLTGVLPDYRRRRIALALKQRALAWARSQGVMFVRTTNDSTNLGMLSINERLGFVKEPAWFLLVRHF